MCKSAGEAEAKVNAPPLLPEETKRPRGCGALAKILEVALGYVQAKNL